MILFRHIAWRAVVAFAASLTAVVGIFLVVDFAENASVFHGPGWVGAVLALYGWRAIQVAYETAPAAMLLAAAVTASGLRRTREYTAMRAVGLGPARVVAPVLAVGGAVALALLASSDVAAVDAAARADEIMAVRFHRVGGLARSAERKRWFRGREGRIYHLRGGGERGAFENVTILDVTPAFRLARRVDAAHMHPGAGGEWVLENGAERVFGRDGVVETTPFARRAYRFDEDPGAFDVRPGRPAQMRRELLREQVQLRRRLGLPAQEFALERQRRFSYPLAGIPAALVALGLALRRERRGHLTAALLEAVGVSVAFWAVQGMSVSLGASGRVAPVLAAWTPDLLFVAIGAALVRRLA